jgi:hypothetical protein
MRVPHTSPRVGQFSLGEHQILLNFESDVGAEAFYGWFEFEGGSEAFAAWVQDRQIREGRFPSLKLKDSKIISWEDDDE